MNEELHKLLDEKSELYDKIEAQAYHFQSNEFRDLPADQKAEKVRERGRCMARMRELQERIAALKNPPAPGDHKK